MAVRDLQLREWTGHFESPGLVIGLEIELAGENLHLLIHHTGTKLSIDPFLVNSIHFSSFFIFIPWTNLKSAKKKTNILVAKR